MSLAPLEVLLKSSLATIFGPAQQHLEISRKLVGPLSAFAAYDHSPLSWLRTQRDNDANRLIYNQQKGLGGLRCALGRHGLLVGPIVGHGVEGVDHRDDARGHRDLLEPEVAGAVEDLRAHARG